MSDELLRRGGPQPDEHDLVLVRSETSERAGLYRYTCDGELRPAGALEREEWVWVLTCAAPLALSVLPSPLDPRATSTGPCRVID